jgi:hypothetical protein
MVASPIAISIEPEAARWRHEGRPSSGDGLPTADYPAQGRDRAQLAF